MDEFAFIIYRNKDCIKLCSNYKELRDAKEKYTKHLVDNNSPELSDFSIIGYLTITKSGYKISSINHYNTFF